MAVKKRKSSSHGPVASYIIKKAAVYNRAAMLISLGPREQFSRKLWEHGVAVLGRERSAKLMSFHTFNGEPTR